MVYTWMPQAAVYAQLRGLPVVLEVHDRPTGKLGPWLLQRTVKMRGQKRLAVITRALVRVLETEFDLSIPEEVLVIAPDAVDLERYDNLPEAAVARAQLGLPARPNNRRLHRTFVRRAGSRIIAGAGTGFSNGAFFTGGWQSPIGGTMP